ncbi:MAG: tRNA dimethylallyltransferase [Parcubacteria group bacterium]|nr:tRNA dimethylallyltransferase [Parcubacteria group bacterium]
MSSKARKPLLLVILGATASGKTDLAIALTKKFNGEIVNADSRAVYRYMDIGTAKPIQYKIVKIKNKKVKSKKINGTYIINGVAHHLFDIATPDKPLSVGEYKKIALKTIDEILALRKLSILVGGSMLYIDAITENYSLPPVEPNDKLRAKIEREIKKYGLKKIAQKIFKFDPAARAFLDSNNPRRVVRAYEVILSTGKKFSELRKKETPIFNVLKIGIQRDRDELYQRINARMKKMINDGLLDETRLLLKKYAPSYHSLIRANKRRVKNKRRVQQKEQSDPFNAKIFKKLPHPLQGHIYKQIIHYLTGELSLDEAVRIAQRDTRHYAKRQLAWFKKDTKIKWVSPHRNTKEATAYIKQWLTS